MTQHLIVRWRAMCLVLAATSLVAVETARGQVPPEEHAKHHGGQSTEGKSGQQPSRDGMMQGGMGGMMEHMKGTPTPQLYPSLMGLPALTPEVKATIERQAHDRMLEGTSLVSDALKQLLESTPNNDYAAMQQASEQMREGLARFESGLAAHRAVEEGKPPRHIALEWFKREMELLPPSKSAAEGGLFGASLFHAVLMAGLVAFAVTMIAMYFFKMKKAANLLQGLTGGGVTQPASAQVQSPGTSASEIVARMRRAISPTQQPRTTPSVPSGKWSGQLRLSRIFQETPDVKTFRLMNPLGGALPFGFMPGQFLTVTVPTDDKPVRRSYTIASSPTQHDYAEITVKHEEGGVVSGFLHDRVTEGDLLECSGPTGSFIFSGRECKCILLIGGGVGITPLMSVVRYLTDRCWPGDIYLLYCIHNPQDFIFREELDYLHRRHSNLNVTVTVTHPEGTDWKGHTGRITKELISQSVPDLASRYVHLCGPVPMMEAIKRQLAELGVPTERIKTEAFGPALGKPEPIIAPPAGVGVEEKAAAVALPTVSFSLSDKSAPLPHEKTVLDVADEIGVDIDNSCRVGTCGTCRVKLLSGSVTMAVEEGLEPGDKENGIILACQAKAISNVTVEA